MGKSTLTGLTDEQRNHSPQRPLGSESPMANATATPNGHAESQGDTRKGRDRNPLFLVVRKS
ncbi:hypothetical protein HW132_21115 [Brasilonema sp. CT11]|nr:hypothetical protein [Brasilonema sp. CT11]